MRCPIVVGRDRELAALTEQVGAARAGAGGWVTVTGEAGVGKSRLVAEAAGLAAAAGMMVLTGRCSPADTLTPYRPVAEALLSALRETPPPAHASLRPYLPAIARFVPHWRTAAGVALSESPAVIGESVVRVLSWLAGGSGLALVLEDMHWADAETLAVCEYLADHAAESPVCVIATARTGEGPASAGEGPASAGDGPASAGDGPAGDGDGRGALAALTSRTVQVDLAPLAAEHVAEMAAACLAAVPSAAVMDILEQAAGGLPLLVEDLLDEGPGGTTRFGRMIRQRLQRLPAAHRGVVAAAALLGGDVDAKRLSALCRMPLMTVSEAIENAVRVQLLTRRVSGVVAFRHALTRDAVLAGSPAERAAVVARAAAVLDAEAEPEAASRAAGLWAEAGDRARSSRAWRRAAIAAAAAGAPASALSAWQHAVAAAPGPEMRRETELGLLRHLSTHGPVDEALALGGRLLDDAAHRPGPEREIRQLMARCCLAAGRLAQAGRQLSELSAALAGAAPDACELVLGARLALAQGGGERRIEAEHMAHQAVAQAERAGQPELVCEALDVISRCARTRRLEDAAQSLRRALAVADAHGLAGWRLRALNELGTVEMLAAADGSRLRRAQEAALAGGALDVSAGISVNLASLHAMRGELDAATETARRAQAEAGQLGMAPLVAAALAVEAAAAGLRGLKDALGQLLRRSEELAPDDPDLSAFRWGVGRGQCALVREERAEAVAAFRRAIRTQPPAAVLDTARGPLLLTLAAEGTATDADLAAARATATPGAGWSGLWLGYGQAAMAGLRHNEHDAAVAFAAAEAPARRHPLFRAIGLRLLAEAALRDQWGEPVSWLREAEAVFVSGGQDRIAAACRGLLRQAGASVPRRRGADRSLSGGLLRLGVTAREAEVLGLVAERLANKDIAARLYLSPRTVEKHVASLLAKLGAENRSSLIDRARNLPADHARNLPADHARNLPADHARNSPADHARNSPADHARNSPADHARNSPAGRARNP